MDSSGTSSRFQRFCDTSTMHGYMEMYNAKCWLWRLFWAVIVAGSIGVTCLHVYNGVDQFINQGTFTAIEPATNERVFYPPLKFCPYHWVYWLDSSTETFDQFGYSATMHGLSYIGITYSEHRIDLEEAAINFTMNFKRNNLDTITDFFKAIAKPVDKLFNLSSDYYSTDDATSIGSKKLFSEIEFVVWKNKFFLCYVASGESIKAYFKEVKGGTVDGRNIIELKYPNKVAIDSQISSREYGAYMYEWIFEGKMINPGKRAAVDFNSYNMPKILFVDGFSDSNLFIKEEDGISNYFVKIKGSANVWNSKPNAICDKNFRSIESNQTCNQICKEETKDKVSRLKGNKNCTNIEHALYLIKRMADYPQKICRHKTLVTSDSDGFENDTSMYYKFEKVDEKTIAAMKQECSAKCAKACEKWAYDFDAVATSFQTSLGKGSSTEMGMSSGANVYAGSSFTLSTESDKTETTINIEYPLDGTILVMTETNSQTWENFVGNIGGLLGIWTGASILSLLQMIYICFCADLVCSRPSHKKTPEIDRKIGNAAAMNVNSPLGLQIHDNFSLNDEKSPSYTE